MIIAAFLLIAFAITHRRVMRERREHSRQISPELAERLERRFVNEDDSWI